MRRKTKIFEDLRAFVVAAMVVGGSQMATVEALADPGGHGHGNGNAFGFGFGNGRGGPVPLLGATVLGQAGAAAAGGIALWWRRKRRQ